jgi:hypothetical protein
VELAFGHVQVSLAHHPSLIESAENLREKGADRNLLFRELVDKYHSGWYLFYPASLGIAFVHLKKDDTFLFW